MRKSSLGRGLSQLISGDDLAQSRAVIEVGVERLQPNPYQPRAEYSDESLTELAESVRNQGILQPLLVRPAGEDYEIVIGERRWRAAEQVELATVPCIVQEVSDEQALALALIENLQRDDLTCIETAVAYQRLSDQFGLTQEDLSQRMGKSRSAVANTLRLLQLPEEIQMSIHTRRISEGHGRALLALSDDRELLVKVWRQVEERGLSVRETEALVRQSPARRAKEPKTETMRAPDPHLEDVADRLQEALATRVTVQAKRDGGGAIVVHYHNPEELERLLDLISPEEII